MVDLEGLKKRIELVDAQMKTAHSTRERESAALKQLWAQIEDRFDTQTGEIRRLRQRVSELEDVRDDLAALVDDLLGAVETGLTAMNEETVPQIRRMADTLLSDEVANSVQAQLPSGVEDEETEGPAIDEAGSPDDHDELLAAIERSLEASGDIPDHHPIEPSPPQKKAVGRPTVDAVAAETQDDLYPTQPPAPISPQPISPGIRNLVERLEGVSFAPSTEQDDVQADLSEDELSRDLREIEALRGELLGLRQRISGGAE